MNSACSEELIDSDTLKMANWLNEKDFLEQYRQNLPRAIITWLFDTESLTAKIRQLNPAGFSLALLRQNWGFPSQEECVALDITAGQRAVVREIHLCLDGEPWTYGRVVFPRRTLSDDLEHLHQLGLNSLGDRIFQDPNLRRSAFQCCQLINTVARQPNLFARRSVFYLADKPLMVTEILLPNLLAHLTA